MFQGKECRNGATHNSGDYNPNKGCLDPWIQYSLGLAIVGIQCPRLEIVIYRILVANQFPVECGWHCVTHQRHGGSTDEVTDLTKSIGECDPEKAEQREEGSSMDTAFPVEVWEVGSCGDPTMWVLWVRTFQDTLCKLLLTLWNAE